MSKPGILGAGALLTAASLSLAFMQNPTPKPAPGPVVTFAGQTCAIATVRYEKITDEAKWAELWLEHKGVAHEGDYHWFYNQGQVPVVDFEQCMVIAVFQGKSWNSAGVVVKQVLVDADAVTVRFEDLSFQTAGPDGGGERARPYGMFVLARSDKPIVLEENVQNLIGQPAKWRQRAKL